MLSSTRTALSLLGKLALSLAAVVLFLFLSAKVPYLDMDAKPTTWQSLSGVQGVGTGSAAAAMQAAVPGSIAFADENSLFSGEFQLAADGQGFSTREVEVDGACSNAGMRYLQASCPECVLMESAAQPGQPATILWVHSADDAGTSGSIFRDCTQRLPNHRVRVVMLEFHAAGLDLAGNTASSVDMTTPLVPSLPGAQRVSVMTLGEWTIVVDQSNSTQALSMMEAQLVARGWQPVAGDAADSLAAASQRTFKRGGMGLSVVTESIEGDQRQLVTMTNGL